MTSVLAKSTATHAYAPTPINPELVPPGACTVDRAGPAFITEAKKIMPCFRAASRTTTATLKQTSTKVNKRQRPPVRFQYTTECVSRIVTIDNECRQLKSILCEHPYIIIRLPPNIDWQSTSSFQADKIETNLCWVLETRTVSYIQTVGDGVTISLLLLRLNAPINVNEVQTLCRSVSLIQQQNTQHRSSWVRAMIALGLDSTSSTTSKSSKNNVPGNSTLTFDPTPSIRGPFRRPYRERTFRCHTMRRLLRSSY